VKNSDPKIIALKLALPTAVSALFLLILLVYLFNGYLHAGIYLLLAAGIFSFAWLTIYYGFVRESHRKIRLIHKHVLQLQKGHDDAAVPPNEKDYADEINRILEENAKEQKEEIDHLMQMELYRKEFLGNVSHELKTPIFNVQGYIHTLIDGGIEDYDINLLYLNKAARSIDRLISIVEDLESISKIESGQLILELRTFDITELAREVLESSELMAREKKIHLYIKETTNKPNYVYADKERIRQVLVNLIVNSIKYGRENGFTEVRFYDYDDQVTIEIEDNGTGIEKQNLPRIFERFFRVDKSRSRIQGGTGLGLAIVKHIIEAHFQKIGAVSEPGHGTTFTFTLKKSK